MLEPSRSRRNGSEHIELVCENCKLRAVRAGLVSMSAGFSQTGEGKPTLLADICLT